MVNINTRLIAIAREKYQKWENGRITVEKVRWLLRDLIVK